MHLRPVQLVFLLALGCVTAPKPPPQPRPPPTLAEQIDTLVAGAEAKGTLIGAYAVDVQTGEVIYAHREHAHSNPASTLKLATTAAALAALGPDFQFRTTIALQGGQKGELFEGDIVITASGDPTFGSRHFYRTEQLPARIVDVLAARGIKRWRGTVRIAGGDVAPQDRLGPGWAWDDEASDFSAPTGPFVFHDNVVHLIVHRPGGGTPCGDAYARISPPVEGISVDVKVTPGEKNEGLTCVWGSSGTDLHCTWPLPTDQCAQHSTDWISVDDPQALFESSLLMAFRDAGIIHLAGDARIGKEEPQPILQILSPPLSEIVYETNKHSLNLCAERLAMTVARARAATEGYAALHVVLAQDQAGRGIAPADFFQVDGSGLSRYDLVSSYGLVQLIRSTLGTPYELPFLASLPITGIDGTLRSHDLLAPARAWAKTGTLSGQRGFAGFVVRPADPVHSTVVFALLIGNSLDPREETSAFFDRFAEILALAPLPKPVMRATPDVESQVELVK